MRSEQRRLANRVNGLSAALDEVRTESGSAIAGYARLRERERDVSRTLSELKAQVSAVDKLAVELADELFRAARRTAALSEGMDERIASLERSLEARPEKDIPHLEACAFGSRVAGSEPDESVLRPLPSPKGHEEASHGAERTVVQMRERLLRIRGSLQRRGSKECVRVRTRSRCLALSVNGAVAMVFSVWASAAQKTAWPFHRSKSCGVLAADDWMKPPWSPSCSVSSLSIRRSEDLADPDLQASEDGSLRSALDMLDQGPASMGLAQAPTLLQRAQAIAESKLGGHAHDAGWPFGAGVLANAEHGGLCPEELLKRVQGTELVLNRSPDRHQQENAAEPAAWWL